MLSEEKPAALLVCKETSSVPLITGALQGEGMDVHVAATVTDGIRCLLKHELSVIVVALPDVQAQAWFLKHAAPIRPWAQCIVMDPALLSDTDENRGAVIRAVAEAHGKLPEARRRQDCMALSQAVEWIGSICGGVHVALDGSSDPNLPESLSATVRNRLPCVVSSVLDMTRRNPRLSLKAHGPAGHGLLAAMRREVLASYEVLTGHSIEGGHILVEEDGAVPDRTQGETIGSVFHIPIVTEDRIEGILSFGAQGQCVYAQPDTALLCHFVNDVASAFSCMNRVFHMANRDALTGLHNRGWFDHELHKAWLLRERYGHSFAVIFVDVDGLKAINDSYGHPAGDLMLCDIAALLTEGVRELDMVARYGGDEFVVILPFATAEQSLGCAERLVASVSKHIVHKGGRNLQISVSVGLATSTSPGVQKEADVLRVADLACYLAKERGKGRVCTADQIPACGASREDRAICLTDGEVEKPACPGLPGGVFVVDDDPAVCKVFQDILPQHGFKVWTETNPIEAVRRILDLWPEVDVVITDLRMPEMDGVQMMEALRNISEEIGIIMVTGYASADSAIGALRAGAYDVIRKPVNIAELEFVLSRAIERRRLRRQLDEYRVHLEDMLRERTRSLDEALSALAGSYMATMEALSTALEKRERQVAAHDKRGAEYAAILARAMEVPDSEIVTINRGAMLHDIGKIGVPDAILHKPGPLTEDEWKIMREHPNIGFQIVHAIPFLKAESDVVYSHHERYDGKGYPRGLRGDQICLGARIFAVADAFEAMRTDRPYRKALSIDKALQELSEGAGTQFDPDVVAAFFRCYRDMDVTVRQ